MKNAMKKNITLIFIALAAFIFSSTCEDPITVRENVVGNGGGLIAISIGGGNDRSALPWDDTIDIGDLDHTITFTGGPGEDVRREGVKEGQTVLFSVAPGHWLITVEAYLGDTLVAEGSASVDIKQGPNDTVLITMKQVMGVEQPVISKPLYAIKIDKINSADGDTVTVSPNSGHEGDIVTLTYTVVNGAHYNLLDFDGVTVPIASVKEAETGTRNYTINASDASSDGTITIIAVFEHTNLIPDPIEFTIGHINKIYGNEPFTNAFTSTPNGNGIITYHSSDTTVATVNDSGEVTILKPSSEVITITAAKAADDVYAHAQTAYTLTVNPKPVTITVLSVADKVCDGTTTATVTGTAEIDGLVGDDDVTVKAGTATFTSATVGNGKTVTFSGWSLTGVDAGNYTLPEQPASVTANITSTTSSKGIELVWIPAGTFVMGSPETEPNHENSETQHSVTLTKSFYMSKYQVTQSQYQAVMGKTILEQQALATTPSTDNYGREANYPIYYVSWYDAIVFCNKLSMIEELEPVYSIGGKTDPSEWEPIPTSNNQTWNDAVMDRSKNGYRLPTEAEWEYACRGDYPDKATKTDTNPFGVGDGTKMLYSMANFNGEYPYNLEQGQYSDPSGTYLEKTTAVGSYAANNYGLYDMHGNVWEWCWDWYVANVSGSQTDPTGAGTGSYRVRRGGGWLGEGFGSKDLRSACRRNNYPFTRSKDLGFRLVRSGGSE